MQVAKKLEMLNMKIGRIEPSSRPEYVMYDPAAKAFCKHNGQITIDGTCKINASKPRRSGELEFYDASRAAEYIAMPSRISNLEQAVKEILSLLKNRESNSQEYYYRILW
jgi:hypothetical protein